MASPLNFFIEFKEFITPIKEYRQFEEVVDKVPGLWSTALISYESGEFCEGTVGHLARVDCYCHSDSKNKLEKGRLFLGALVGGPLLVASR